MAPARRLGLAAAASNRSVQGAATRTGKIASAASMTCAYCSTAIPMPHVSDMISITYEDYVISLPAILAQCSIGPIIVWAARGGAHDL
jgi:hypothetical protein